MSCRLIDRNAVRIPESSGLPQCLYVPIGARDRSAIETYVGRVLGRLSRGADEKALLVEAYEPEPPDPRLPIWAHPAAGVLHSHVQVWVHVDYTRYRWAYSMAFPGLDLTGVVLDHVLNRRVARLTGFPLLRIVPISREANSSHGGLSEGWGVDLHRTPTMSARDKASKAQVRYADLADIVKMLNMEGGGPLMEAVNDAQRLVSPPRDS